VLEGLRSLFLHGRLVSADYWETRYRRGGSSGAGSYGELAAYKADFINGFAVEHGVRSTIEFGCGDGGQAARLRLPQYTGVDVSETAVAMCRSKLGDRDGWRFANVRERDAWVGRYDLALSLDVIYHLVEDAAFDAYMADLFDHSRAHVLVYASDKAQRSISAHVRHRRHGDWVAARRPGWVRLADHANPLAGTGRKGSFARFTHYARVQE
jgi:cyclopropane fatty-acyl-phospholipid synthase-like methyltransferase